MEPNKNREQLLAILSFLALMFIPMFGVSVMGTGAVPNPELKKICDRTDYPGLCLQIIAPLLKGSKVDPESALGMAISASTQETKLTIDAATKMANTPLTPSSTAKGLKECREHFDDALENLEAAAEAIQSKDIGTVNTMLSAAITDYGTCDDAFEQINPMKAFDDKLSDMASICLAVASLIQSF